MMKMMFLFSFIGGFFVTIFYINFFFYFSLYWEFFNFFYNYSSNMKILVYVDEKYLSFFWVVLMVTCLVMIYSEIYLEHYNNKKFNSLLIFFLLSMIFLSMSGSFPLLFLGWDGLGLSSIFLVMFYPNNNSMINSLITMVFNRLGDLFLMISASFILMKSFSSTYYYLSEELLVLILMVLCAMTKSAQFPLSAWLPSAMSAPTPISAMVHSSTLVTAGIYLIYKIEKNKVFLNVKESFLCINLLTMIAAGLIIMTNKDLKKIIAFSTMMQVSLILSLCMFSLLYMSLIHLIFHALFKSLMFVCAGIFFSKILMNQKFSANNKNKNSIMILILMMFTFFSISGLCFSCSFYSKGVSLEELWFFEGTQYSLYFFLGSVLTVMYSSKMMNLFNNFILWKSCYTSMKNYNSYFFLFFFFLILFIPLFMNFLLNEDLVVMLFSKDLLLFDIFFFFIFFFQKKILIPFFKEINSGNYLKFCSFSFLKKIMNKFMKNQFISEKFFFTKNHLMK